MVKKLLPITEEVVIVTILNQYSFLITGLLLLVVVAFMSWRILEPKYAVPAIGLASILLVISQLFLSTNANSYSSVASFENALTSGKPVLLELYSNY